MKSILITGANRGIGLELAKIYAHRDGWHVYAACRSPENATALAELEQETGSRVTLHRLDVSDKASVAALAKELEGKPIDILVNNAGTMGGKSPGMGDVDTDEWLDMFTVNSIGPFLVTQALLPNLRAAKGAKVATVSSQMGALSRKDQGFYAYCSSKAAVNKVMQIMAANLEADDIAVCLLHPGWVQTDMGGAMADIAPHESAAGLARVIDGLTMEKTGRFFKWNGEEHAW